MDGTYLSSHLHDIVFGFPVSCFSAFLVVRLGGISEGRAYSSAALAPTVLGVRAWRTFTWGAPLSKPAVDIATAQPIADADASVIAFMSVQVLQVSCLSTRNLLSDSTKYWRSTVILSVPFLLAARWRYFVLWTEVKSGWRSRRWEEGTTFMAYWLLPDGLLGDLSRGLGRSASSLPAESLGRLVKVSLLCHSEFGSVLFLVSFCPTDGANLLIQKLDDP
ncbi:hypothetical protein Tco_0411185 [Tanacetum coccineum]